MIIFVTGGQASGKSDFALDLLYRGNTPQVFIATGKARDFGFREQINLHRAARPATIPVLESGVDLAASLGQALSLGRTILLDSLDFWYFLVLTEARTPKKLPDARVSDLLAVLDELSAPEAPSAQPAPTLIVVSSETGLGPVAADPTSRAFTRGLGRLNAKISAKADSSWLVVAGNGIQLKDAGERAMGTDHAPATD